MKSLRKNTAKWQPDSTLPLINVVLLLVLVFMIAGTVASPLPADFTPLQTVAGEARFKINPDRAVGIAEAVRKYFRHK